MNRTLVRTAFNPLLYEVQDFGLGIVSADGRLWAEAPGIAGFISALSDTIRSGVEMAGPRGFRAGDLFIVNDPYLTGTHISDTSVYAPVFHGDDLVAFSIVTAHWADIGGKTPSGWSPDTTDVYQEGICFQHQRLVAEGTQNDELFSLIRANVRYPDLVRGDLEAQMAAVRQGNDRVRHLCARYGAERVTAAMDDVIARTDAAMRRRFAELPDGRYEASVSLDGDGVDPEAEPRVCVQVNVRDDRLLVTFDGTSAAARGPINDPGARCDVRCAVKGLFAPFDVGNEGHIMAVDFDVPPGLLVSPERPAPVDSYGYVGVALIELVIRALAPVLPEAVPASGYQIWASNSSTRGPARWGAVRVHGHPRRGAGARPDRDGPVLIFAGDGDTRNVPVEVIETRYPLRVERHELLPGLAGAGRVRGGAGVARDFRMLEDGIRMQYTNENVSDPLAKGIAGGGDGAPGSVVVHPGSEREAVLRMWTSHYGPFSAGDVISVRSGGGGGLGRSFERAPERVALDVLDGIVDAGEAARVYGVVVTEAGGVDEGATDRLRRAKGSEHA